MMPSFGYPKSAFVVKKKPLPKWVTVMMKRSEGIGAC